jgi:hypothetical protein
MNTTDRKGDYRIGLTSAPHRFNLLLLMVMGVFLGLGVRIVHLFRLGRLSWAELASGATVEAGLAGLAGALMTTGFLWFVARVLNPLLSKR